MSRCIELFYMSVYLFSALLMLENHCQKFSPKPKVDRYGLLKTASHPENIIHRLESFTVYTLLVALAFI